MIISGVDGRAGWAAGHRGPLVHEGAGFAETGSYLRMALSLFWRQVTRGGCAPPATGRLPYSRRSAGREPFARLVAQAIGSGGGDCRAQWNETMRVLFDNHARVLRVRALTLAFLGLALVVAWYAYALWQGHLVASGESGMLRTAGEHQGLALGIGALGLLPALCMVAFVRRYVVRIERDHDDLRVAVVGVLRCRTRVVPLARIRCNRFVEGYLRTGRQTVHAPWISLMVEGELLPYIVDGQALHIDTVALLGLGRGAPVGRRPRRR
jgi:hypothetical protein